MTSRLAQVAFLFLVGAAPTLAADDKSPEPCCVLRLTPAQVDVLIAALPAAPIPANQSMPVYQEVLGQARAEQKASADWETAHAAKPEKK